jgi:hypothetical protein
MGYLEFFTTDNKSGWKTREDVLKNKEPEIYNSIKKFIGLNGLDMLPFKQQVWHFIHNVNEKPVCLNCGSEVKFRDTIAKGYRSFCSMKCTNESDITQNRAVEAVREKYGVDYFPQHESHILKVKKTKLERYGDENYNNMSKVLQTKELKYGDKNYINRPKHSLTVRDNLLVRLQKLTTDKIIKYEINDKYINLICSSCNQNYDIYQGLLKYRCSVNVKPCTLCNPIRETDSIQEKELFEFVSDLLPNKNVFNKDRTIISNIKPIELDIYIPSHKLAIEYNGLYWHSEKFENKNHLLVKKIKCNEKDIDLIHIFEDEWIFKKPIIKSIIKSKLGLLSNKIHARKTEIREVSPKDSKEFLNINHLQGSVNSKHKIGLYYDNELVSLMTFGPLRKNMGSKSEEGSVELYRFCNKLDTNVIGGFSKLFKHFIKTQNPKQIITFSDNRFFNGKVYIDNGFKFVSETDLNYFYIVNHKRENRFSYRKDVLVKEGYDKNKTEREIMKERGINRIYDCGNKKWVYNNNQKSL